MTKIYNFLAWDLASGNEMCFCCERSGNKDKMCSWGKSLEPVPGWIGIEASEMQGVQSVKILRCPKFLDSQDDPGMTREEYLQSCRGLIIELYSKTLEYKSMFLKMKDQKTEINSELRQLQKDYKALQRQLAAKESPPEQEAS